MSPNFTRGTRSSLIGHGIILHEVTCDTPNLSLLWERTVRMGFVLCPWAGVAMTSPEPEEKVRTQPSSLQNPFSLGFSLDDCVCFIH